ncbi:MAG: type I-U CRISPR-associated helicase/endonuclease Cas3 [Bryobacterales bacterium]|nr:type I-U CRISPR-associated helicase/endonuclease Cas3 [Bryobacterales bacterium]
MTSADFIRFYSAVHNRPPFPWLTRLVDTVLTGRWPETIAIPTGCGKTSVIDAAVFSLAAQAGVPSGRRTAPLRIFFVVDRRLVVDDAAAHAETLAKALQNSSDPVVAEVRERLLRFGAASPLALAALRGGMYRSDAWIDSPNQPLVCASTVDQVGSRLLFRGYGVSDSRRPVHAALTGNDALIILDEAHLSRPFLDTLRQVARYQSESWAGHPPAAGLRVVEMSATTRNAGSAFRLEPSDYESALKPRLEARKIAELAETAALERSAADEALRLAKDGAAVTGVVLNTVASARSCFELLRSGGHEAILLTGRVRPYDREQLVDRILPRVRTGRTRAAGDPLFVVATQTIEVGADLDFDALVTEAAPLDALRQRFGRLDRIGELGSTRAVILKPKRAKVADWIYGEPLENTWQWLRSQAASENGSLIIDFGVRSMAERFEQAGSPELVSASEPGPLLFPAHLDAWAQTNPAPAADPAVAPFLHGPGALQAPDVQIVWRADLPGNLASWPAAVSLAPPLVTEALPLPIGTARRWLQGEAGQATDLESSAQPDGETRAPATRDFLIWRGPDKSQPGRLADLRPGDTVVVRSAEGGCDAFGWNPASGPVPDIGDLCAKQRAAAGLGRYRVRLHPWVLYPGDEAKRAEFTRLLQTVAEEEDTSLLLPVLREFAPAATGWRITGEETFLAVSRWPERPAQPVAWFLPPEETDEDDQSSLTRNVTLREHCAGVAKLVQHFSQSLGLPPPLTAALDFAAAYHDLGKSDHRFQMLLDRARGPLQEPLAKGEPAASAAEYRRRRELAGYPEGARHEFASLALAAQLPCPEDCDRDLALYLIGAHHGYGRPWPPVWDDDPNHEITARVDGRILAARRVHEVASLSSGWLDRYWALTGRYGWWGLACLETILRCADCLRSRYEQENRA